MSHGVRRLDLFVTEACNLGCPYCFAATQPRKNPTLKDSQRAVDWLMRSDSKRVHVTLWGGEPLLRKSLLRDVVTYARACADALGKTVSFSMPTNASMIDHETAQWLRDNDIKVFLSIDGDEEGQATRPLKNGGSSHELVQLGMKQALSSRPAAPPAVRMTVTPDNAANQGSSVRYFVEQGVRELMIYAAFDQPWSDEEVASFEAGQREVASQLVELVRRSEDPSKIPGFKAWKPTLKRLLDGVPERPRQGELHHCGAGTELVALTVEGKLAPCHRFVFYGRNREEGIAVGDLESGVDDTLTQRFGELRVEDIRGVTRCVECELYDLCTFGCIAISYATSGELDRVPDAACRLMEAQVRVCREIHDQLENDPRYAVYLGRSVENTVRAAVGGIAARALSIYDSRAQRPGRHA